MAASATAAEVEQLRKALASANYRIKHLVAALKAAQGTSFVEVNPSPSSDSVSEAQSPAAPPAGAEATAGAVPLAPANEEAWGLLDKVKLVVGRVISAERHADADSLYVESVDCGEAQPRQVVSGLAKFMPAAALVDRNVVLVANMKPSKMRGVESQAMLLAASSADGLRVEIVSPAAGAVPGEAVEVESRAFAKTQAEPNARLNPKKKVMPKVSQHLRTRAGDHALVFGDVAFRTASGLLCTTESISGEVH